MAGAFLRTSNDALDVESHLLPAQLSMKHKATETALRMAAREPGRTLFADTTDTDIEDAIEDHNRKLTEDAWHIYTNGSGIDGRVGAAAYCLENNNHLQNYVGPFSRYTVYCGETHILTLAIRLVAQLNSCRPIHIFTNNKGVVQTTTDPMARGGQQFLRQFHQEIRDLPWPAPITVTWIPSHTNIFGNETSPPCMLAGTWHPAIRLSPPSSLSLQVLPGSSTTVVVVGSATTARSRKTRFRLQRNILSCPPGAVCRKRARQKPRTSQRYQTSDSSAFCGK